MTLYLIGLGLSDVYDVTVKGMNAARSCDKLFLETYTSKLQTSIEDLEKFYGKPIVPATRDLVENRAEETILPAAKEGNAAFLVIGDPLAATTHIDLMLRAQKAGIKVEIIHNASIMNAVASTGLQLYKFGKTTSIPFPEKSFEPETPYNVIKENGDNHTLLLLDLRPGENRFMSVGDAIRYLLRIELKKNEKVFTEKTFVVGCARIGSNTQKITAGEAGKIIKLDFGPPVHCLIVPGKLHFLEEEFLNRISKN